MSCWIETYGSGRRSLCLWLQLVAGLILGLTLTGTTCSASLLQVAANGTYDSNISTSFFTSPNGIWTLSFNIDSNPTPSSFILGDFFVAAVSLTYTLNGSLVPVGSMSAAFPREVGLPGPTRPGGLVVCFSGNNCGVGLLEFNGQTLYSGSEAAPTILPGSYPVGIGVGVNGMFFFQPDSVVRITATPEPSTMALFLSGLMLACGLATKEKIQRGR